MQTSRHPELAAQLIALPPLLLYQLFASFPSLDLLLSCVGTPHPAPPAVFDLVPSTSIMSSTACYLLPGFPVLPMSASDTTHTRKL